MNTPTLCIRLFGPLELAWGDESCAAPSSPKARSLLAYLILHRGRAVPRDRMAGIFWPERSDVRARRALSNALWQIRRALGPAGDRLIAERDFVTFSLHPDDRLDVATFEKNVHAASLPKLSEAVALYRADFLEACYDDWALVERERLRELYLRVLEQLTTLHKQRGDYEQAVVYAQRLAAADPLREAAHRELMRLYHLLDRPRAALEQFAALRDLLEEELGIPPAPVTVALRQEIAAALEEAGAPHLPIAPSPPPLLRDLAHLPFIGRTDERAALIGELQAADQGHGGLALLEGDAGVGKTRLIHEVIADAEWRGLQVGLGKADPLIAATPYQLLQDALSPLLTPLRIAQLAELIEPAQLSAITPLFPAIGEHLSDLSPLVSLDPHGEQRRLWEGLAQCIVGLASAAPLLLVLEDLHWADETTLATLPHLIPYLSDNRVFLILTYRTAEAREHDAVWKTLESLGQTTPLLRLCLLPFEQAEATALVQRALGVSKTDAQAVAFAWRLQGETGGNALFLVETLRALLEQGSLVPSDDGGWLFPPEDQPVRTPASVHQLIGGRLAHLSPPTRAVLEQVAVLGDDADFPTLVQVSEMEMTALLPVLAEMERRGFLVAPETEARYRFEHDRIREAVYQAISPEHRRALHQRAGLALERLHPERIESLAHHFSRGELWDKAAAYNRRAGDRARAIYAGAEAIDYYSRALEAWRHLRPSDEHLGLDLYQARGEICQETGRFDPAEADFRAAYALAEKVGDRIGQARALNHLSYLQFQRGDFGGAVAIAQQALGLAATDGLQSEIATGLFNQANALRNQGHYQQAIDLYEQAAIIFEQLDEQASLADCLNRMGASFYHVGAFARAYSLLEQSLVIRRRIEDKAGISYSLINLAMLYYYLGRFDRMREAAQEALEIANIIDDPYGKDAALHDLGLAALEHGDPTQAIPSFQRALEIARKIGDRALEPETLAELGRAYYHLGNLDRAQETLKQALDVASVSVEQNYVPIIHAYSALVFLDVDKSALKHARAGLQEAEEKKDLWSLGVTHRAMGQVVIHLGSERAAEKPTAHFEKSIHILRELGAEAELGRSLAAYGLYLRRSSDPDEVQRGAAMVDEARTLFQRLEMAWDLAQLETETSAQSQLDQIDVQLPHVDAPTGRPLRAEEMVEVTWTLATPDDDAISGKVARRRQRILRLLQEAARQSAAPTVADLVDVLNVSERTIKRDLAALRAAGHAVSTRGARA
jgi:DNA-binding SARP family transcriptional activator/tetratricopeptide (TPR) repeat protein